MRLSLCALVVILSAAPPLLAQREFGFDNRKPSGQPYISPEETVKRFKVAPEFEAKLFAGEPMLANPIAFTIDEKGRIWAIECFEYPKRTPKGQKPRDRIVILEDTNGDGVADKRTVFAEGKDFPDTFDMASGIEVGNGGVFVGAPPYLWFIENKDDKPGKFEILLKGFGSQDTHETLNTFQWGPDGWLYGLHGVFTQSNVYNIQPDAEGAEPIKMNAAVWRFHPKTRDFEIFAEGTSNPWGMDWRNTDGQFIVACCVIPHLFHVVPGGIYKRQAGASFNPYAYGYIDEICDHTFHRESGWAHAGLISLDVPHMPEKYRNSVIFGSIHGCSVKQNILKPNGSTFTASKGEDFLVSGDKNFRPINMKWGPHGDIYLIDWHDQNPCHQTNPDDWDYERGRVYRIQLKDRKGGKAEDLGKKSIEELQVLAASPSPYEGRTARRLLLERRAGKDLVLPSVATITDKTLQEAHQFRMSLDTLAVTDQTLKTLLDTYQKKGLWDSPHVRRELASAAIRLADKHDVTPLVHALMARKDDYKDPVIPHLVWYAYEKSLARFTKPAQDAQAPRSAETEIPWLIENAPGNAFVIDHIIPRVTRRLASTGQPGDLALCVKLLAETKDLAVRRKALEGMAQALQGLQVDAPREWARTQRLLLAVRDQRINELVGQLAVNFRDPQALRRAVATVGNARRSEADRLEAIRQLGQFKAPEAVKALIDLMRSEASEALKAEAVRNLATYQDKDIPPLLVTGWKDFSPGIKNEAVQLLAGRKEWAAALLSAMEQGIIERSAVTDNTILRIQGFKDRMLNDLIETAWGRSRATPAELTALIDKMRGELAAAPASFQRGKKVFETQCSKCHKFEGIGNDVGPSLEGAGRDIEYLLGNILDPNRVIGAPYFIRQVATVDGQLFQGILAEEDDRTLTLKIENGVLRKIPKADLDGEIKILEKSMMPEGLANNMSIQDFRDLVRYLMASPFLTDVTVNGQPVSVGATGLIPIPASTGDKPVTLEAKVSASKPVKTQLLIGSTEAFEVKLNGKPIARGQGTGKRPEPDREAFPLEIPEGDHTLTLVFQSKVGLGVYARLLDPDRKLHYPDVAKVK